MDKCFCHFNGYEVKDAKARRDISNLYASYVDEMKNMSNLEVGSIVKTLGYYNPNDGGGATYLIRNKLETDIEENGRIHFLRDNLVGELLIEDSINVRQFGAKGDSESVDDTYIQNFLNCPAPKHIFTEGTYLIDDDMNVSSNSYIEFMNGAILKRKPTNKTNYYMLNVGNVSNVTIKNAHIIGEKDEHLGTEGQWGYGIHIYSSQYVNILDCVIEDTWGDGVYVGYSYAVTSKQDPKHITIDNCKVINCSRNGYSICSGENIILSNSYSYGVTRDYPKAGIDIEPEGPDSVTPYLKNILIDNFVSDSNDTGIGLITAGFKIENLIINNHTSNNESVGFVIWGIKGESDILYQNAKIIKPYGAGINVSKEKDSNVVIKNVVVDSLRKTNQTHGYDGAIVILTSTENDGNLIIDNVDVLNTYKNLKSFDDIIVERGTGVFTGLTLKNIVTKKYFYYQNIVPTSIEMYDCKIINSSSYYLLDNDKYTVSNYMTNTSPLGANQTRNIGDNLPDGDYEVILNNNTGGYNLAVVFDEELTVYNTSTYGSTSRTYNCNYRGGYLRFHKNNKIITIIENNGFSAA